MNFIDREYNFDIKDLSEIISEIEESRNFLKEIKVFFKRDRTPIFKTWLEEIKIWVNERELYTFTTSMSRLRIIISESYLNQELKLESFISFFFNLKEKLIKNENEFNQFCKSYIVAFNYLELKESDFVNKFKEFTLILIELIGEKLAEHPSIKLIQNYLSLLRLLFELIRLERLNESEFLQYVSILDKFSTEYNIIERYDVLLDYYIQISGNLNKVKKLFFHFLDTYKKKEIFSIHYPDPVKFCENFEIRFKRKPRNFLLNTYLEYYGQHTTNFIPPLFLKKKSLNNTNSLEIIYNNLKSENFISRDLYRYFEILMKSKPRKKVFNQYCQTITGFKSQIFRFNFYKIYESKNMSFSHKFALIGEIIKTKPDFYQIKHHPEPHIYLFTRKNYKKKRNLKPYFRLVHQLENYSDFKMLLFKISMKNKDQRKHFIRISNHSIKKFINRMEQILEYNEFLIIKKLYDIFKTDFYNIYKLGYKTMSEYVSIELLSNSLNLENFLYEHFIEIAQKQNDPKTDNRLFMEYQNFKKFNTISDKTTNDILDEFIYDDLSRNYSIERDHLLTLIKSDNKDGLFGYIDDLITVEQKKRIKNYEKLIILHFLKGEIQICFDFFLEEKEFNRKLKYDKETLTKDNNQQNNLIMFKEILRIEQNFENYGSFQDLLSDLEKLLNQIKQNLGEFFGYFSNFDIYKHYWNMNSFLILIYEYKKEKRNKERLDSILDTLFLDTRFCKEWKDLKKLWRDKIIPNLLKDGVLKYAEDQFNLFKINPLFNGVNKFLSTSLNPGSELFLLFNYDPENLIHDFKEKYYNLNEIFIKKYKSKLFVPLNFGDVRLFNNLHIPFSNSHKDLRSFIITLNTAISDSIIPKVLKIELNLVEWDGKKINLLIKFIEEKYDMENLSVKEMLFGIIELNTFRSEGGITHRMHQDHTKRLSKFSLLNLSNIEISKKIIYDVNVSLENLINLFK